MKEIAKKIGKKMATGCSATKEAIEMQGDMSQQLAEWFPLNIKEVGF